MKIESESETNKRGVITRPWWWCWRVCVVGVIELFYRIMGIKFQLRVIADDVVLLFLSHWNWQLSYCQLCLHWRYRRSSKRQSLVLVVKKNWHYDSSRFPGACTTTAMWRCHKPLNQWQCSFQMKAALSLVNRLTTASDRSSIRASVRCLTGILRHICWWRYECRHPKNPLSRYSKGRCLGSTSSLLLSWWRCLHPPAPQNNCHRHTWRLWRRDRGSCNWNKVDDYIRNRIINR